MLASIAGTCEPVDELYLERLEVTQNVGPVGRFMLPNLDHGDCDELTMYCQLEVDVGYSSCCCRFAT